MDAEAEALIGYFGVEAYCEARQRERGASSEAIARDWGRVARAVTRKTKRRIGLNTGTRMGTHISATEAIPQIRRSSPGRSTRPTI
jgi:hypothetical protein